MNQDKCSWMNFFLKLCVFHIVFIYTMFWKEMYILNKQGIIYGSVTDFDLCNEIEKHWKESQTFKKKRFYIMLTHILGESLKQKYSLHMPVFCVFLFNSHGVGCLCHNGNIQCFINIGQQLSPTDGGWRQKLGQVGSLWTGWHRRVHWNKTKRWHINSRSYQLVT